MQKTSKAKEELKDQSSYIELPEMKSKRKECQDAEKQLIEVEKKLGETFYCFYKFFWKKGKCQFRKHIQLDNYNHDNF